MKRTALFVLSAFIPLQPAANAAIPHQTVVHVASGDCAALEQALNIASLTRGVETGPIGELVVLAKNGSYPNCFGLGTVTQFGQASTVSPGAITIDGNG